MAFSGTVHDFNNNNSPCYHGIYSHLFVCVQLCFLFCFVFLQGIAVFTVKIFTSLVRLICKYFKVFNAIVNAVAFFSQMSLLKYKNATYFCMLHLNSENLLNLLASSKIILFSLRTAYT